MSEPNLPPVPPQQPPMQYSAPQVKPMTPQEERTWGMAAHLIALGAMVFSAGFLGFVASLVLYLVMKDRGPFVRANTANALNIQITTFIVCLVSIPLILILIGIFTLIAALVGAIVLHIIAAVKAQNGEWYNPPFTIRFIK